LPLGAALRLVVARPDRRLALGVVAAVGVLLLQMAVGWISPWPGDMTEVVLAWAGIFLGWLGAARLAELRQEAAAASGSAARRGELDQHDEGGPP
jgi:hypothetical protein